MKYTNFIDDKEKMKDFDILTRAEFLESYSYITEEEYDNTLDFFGVCGYCEKDVLNEDLEELPNKIGDWTFICKDCPTPN